MDEDKELAALQEIIAERQTQIAGMPVDEKRPEPSDETSRIVHGTGQRVSRQLTEKDYADLKKSAENELRWQRWNTLMGERGERYQSCRLSTFVADIPEKKAAVEQLTRFCKQIGELTKSGSGLVLFGSKGTGKDHLAVSCAHAAIGADLSVDWYNGMDLYGQFRDSISDDRPEAVMIREIASPDILYISDPLPPMGSITEYQANTLFRILDRRYSAMRPTWVTVNVSGREELEARMGQQLADRIRDGALSVFCNWPSHRKSFKFEESK